MDSVGLTVIVEPSPMMAPVPNWMKSISMVTPLELFGSKRHPVMFPLAVRLDIFKETVCHWLSEIKLAVLEKPPTALATEFVNRKNSVVVAVPAVTR